MDADADAQPSAAAGGYQTQQGHSSSDRGAYVSAVLERAKSLGMGSHDAAADAAAEAPSDGVLDEAAARSAGIASTSRGGGPLLVEQLTEGDRLLLRMPRRWQVGVSSHSHVCRRCRSGRLFRLDAPGEVGLPLFMVSCTLVTYILTCWHNPGV